MRFPLFSYFNVCRVGLGSWHCQGWTAKSCACKQGGAEREAGLGSQRKSGADTCMPNTSLQSVYLSVYLSICLSVYLSVFCFFVSFCQFVSLSVCLSVFWSVFSVCLSVLFLSVWSHRFFILDSRHAFLESLYTITSHENIFSELPKKAASLPFKQSWSIRKTWLAFWGSSCRQWMRRFRASGTASGSQQSTGRAGATTTKILGICVLMKCFGLALRHLWSFMVGSKRQTPMVLLHCDWDSPSPGSSYRCKTAGMGSWDI